MEKSICGTYVLERVNMCVCYEECASLGMYTPWHGVFVHIHSPWRRVYVYP